MIDSSSTAVDSVRDLVSGLSRLSDGAARRNLLSAHPALQKQSLAERLCKEIPRLVRVDLEAAENLAATVVLLAEDLDDDVWRGRSRRAIGNVRFFQRDYAAALAEYEAALELFQRAGDDLQGAITRSTGVVTLSYLGEYRKAERWAEAARATFTDLHDRLRLARLEFNVGHLYSRRDRFREALAHFRSAHDDFVAAGQPHDVGAALRNIAVCLQDLGDFPAALQAYVRAREYCERNDLPLLGLEVEYNIAYLFYLRGEYTRAIDLFEANRRKCDELDDQHHRALCDLDQAEIFLELNLVEEAARLAYKGHERFERLKMPYETAKSLTSLAVAIARQGQLAKAIDLLGQAREIFEREANQVWPAMIDLYRASALLREGRWVEAAPLAESALAVFSEADLPTKTTTCELLLARLELESGRPEAAWRRCESALARIGELGVPALEYQAHFVAGQALEDLGDLPGALAALRRSQATLEGLRSHLTTDELKIAFLEDKGAVYESLVWLSLDNGASAGEIFGCIEKAKSRSLADLLALRAHSLPAKRSGQDSLAEKLRELREELTWIYRQIDLLDRKGADRLREQERELRQKGGRLEKELMRTLRKLQSSDRELRSLQDSVTFDLETIRSALPEDLAILEYYIARGSVIACLLTRDGVEVEPIAVASRVRDLHRQLQLQLSKFQLGADYVERFQGLIQKATLAFLQSLYGELIEPVADRLRARHLVVVPHGFLHQLPFQALYDGERFLIDRYAISFAPSATVFHLCSIKPPVMSRGALVVGVPDERAPSILEEARTVAETLPESTLLLGDRASREAVTREARSRRIVHISTHGLYRVDNPMFSAIKLGNTRLSLFDLYDLDLDAELAVLSGCGTGLSSVVGADELVGLSRGLLYAGARSVLATLWDVNDESTTRFMRGFYRYLISGLEPAEALQRSLWDLREDYPHPYFWAPFVLIGRARPAG